MTLLKVGVYCLRGGGHWACYDEEDAGACGTKGPDVFIDVEREDYHFYPEWLQRVMESAAPERSQEQEEAFVALLAAAEAEVALKDNQEKGGAEHWAAQSLDGYQVPGVERRIVLSRAVLQARAALAPQPAPERSQEQ